MKGDVFERWEEHTCSLNPAKPAEPVSIEAEGAVALQGMRHRLQVTCLPMHDAAAGHDPQVTAAVKMLIAFVVWASGFAFKLCLEYACQLWL